jgi:hypothetical protein
MYIQNSRWMQTFQATEQLSVRFAVICPNFCEQPFRLATGYSQKLYVDPERTLYKALGCHEKVQFTKRLTGNDFMQLTFIFPRR